MRIIPAIDLKDGNCVRLFKGDFDRVTEYSSDPVAIGRRFSALDVEDLHIVDLDGARSGNQTNHHLVAEIASTSGLAVQLGGGIREHGDVKRWLDAGVSRCVVGSVAVRQPDVVCRWIEEFGAQQIVLALDVKLARNGEPMLTTHGWTQDTGVSLWESLDAYRDVGARHVLCTDVARDGAMAGPNFDLYEQILSRYPGLGLQASGGVRHAGDLQALQALGLPAAITGRALLDGAISDTEVASFRQSA
ncbi:MAG: 1-(5-phosphoribosyl)-5-[(5-phosphoribosylamino)methylideneamino]imidazole-4-carboxamide isomerase [Gammaproteobacteria bacterium]|nr:1-(5-phosphoribosyl)-5-[(5-phosphoribosylamino)methylideneamino]imidazole-4-carboxamide isomerase [Gammaproteobacteria bacterium]